MIESTTINLVANTAQAVTFPNPYISGKDRLLQDFIVTNLSDNLVYVTVSLNDAVIEADDNLVVPAQSTRGLGVPGTRISLISAAASKVEIQGVLF